MMQHYGLGQESVHNPYLKKDSPAGKSPPPVFVTTVSLFEYKNATLTFPAHHLKLMVDQPNEICWSGGIKKNE